MKDCCDSCALLMPFNGHYYCGDYNPNFSEKNTSSFVCDEYRISCLNFLESLTDEDKQKILKEF